MASLTPTDQNSLTNFCCNWLVSAVNCESVTADGYSSSNLISDDPQNRSKGLRVEHYIRPPVIVQVDLCVPVAVSCILVCPDLPPQAEMRLELSGSAVDMGVASYRSLCTVAVVKSGCLLVARSKHFRADIKTQEIVSVPNQTNMVVYSSHGCKHLKRLVHSECPLKNPNVLRHLRHLQLKVIKWTGPKPVSIKWLEVWGVASNACSREELGLFQSRLKASSMYSPKSKCGQPPGMFTDRDSSVRNDQHPPPLQSLSPSLGSASHIQERSWAGQDLKDTPAPPTSSELQIPERFLDELTFEVMVLPMLLPSGHCVDKSTVDRLAGSDAAYGRAPTDPFTGDLLYGLCTVHNCHISESRNSFH